MWAAVLSGPWRRVGYVVGRACGSPAWTWLSVASGSSSVGQHFHVHPEFPGRLNLDIRHSKPIVKVNLRIPLKEILG